MPDRLPRAKFADIVVDRGARSAFRIDETLQLSGLTFDFLLAIIDAAPNAATFDTFADKVWKGRVVTPETIAQRASLLRKALTPDGNADRYFEAVRGVGYRLVPDLEAATQSSDVGRWNIRTVQTIAVMPFENLSEMSDQDFFCDGLVEDITTALSHVRGLLVISRNSTFTFKSKTAPIREIADRLNVGWLLTGSVRRSQDRVRVSVQLVDTATEQTTWTRKFDGLIGDVFDLQDSLTAEIANALDIELVSGEEGRLRLARYSLPAAGEALYRGIFHNYSYDRAQFELALSYFDEFIEYEPESVIGYGWKVSVWAFAIVVGWIAPTDGLPKIQAHVQKIVALNRDDPQALIGAVYLNAFTGDIVGALGAAKEATTVAPNFDEAWFLRSWCQMLAGRPEEAIIDMTRAIRLSPIVPATRMGVLATAYRNAGRLKESIQTFRAAIESYPDFVWAHTGLATAFGFAGDNTAAAREVEIALAMDPTYTVERFTTPNLYVDKSVMSNCAQALVAAGMPKASS